jgi:hypothetical protein
MLIVVALLLTVAALYIDVDVPLAVTFSHRHYSAGAWIAVIFTAVAVTWLATSAWRRLAEHRRARS